MKLLFTWKPPRGLDRIQSAIDGLRVEVSDDPADILTRIPNAEIACVGHWNAEMLHSAKKLRWVHAFSGGVNSVLFPEFVASPIPLTCLKGTFDIPAAEYALGVMLSFSRRLEYDIRQRPQRKFEDQEPTELHGRTVGIIGFGTMGTEIAKRCRCFGMRVLALSRQARTHAELVDEWFTPEQIASLLAASDYVIVALPLTDQTRGMIGTRQLSSMKKSAYLIDVSGRPALYDLDALQKSLRARQIAGASLQMVPPPDSPLWGLDNLLLSYHRIVSREHFDRCIEMFCENLQRYRAGKPLLGLVDKAAGY
jgi:phosphoglycerate dehydrogenase-like enzyme